jgi:hypothetical protein
VDYLTLGRFLAFDGFVFVAIGVLVLISPSPQPALKAPLVERTAVEPFKDTRRLLASQFIGTGLLALALGLFGQDPSLLRLAALARVLTLATTMAINVTQLRAGLWKPGPLYGLLSIFGVWLLAYVYLGLTAR